ncbi:MAG TPA: type II secretion system minor pseudopilin GspK [Saprospiraceae bacterium]|nr:type II secretion system minor pseudopilin GspK [Saprospiraceae bacterium]HMZ00301.1 type II secretion system minor pseudopilin GspK [Burkholderiaceae bacterium]HNB44777.1 type II secretion system minor pseudopilin GspK [Burkholderiaceae bacterium]HNG81982.1 type II secretion system minor pseudopilin GspK [Burkholderiaceae bacterium]
MRRSQPTHARQHGAALLTAMIIVALIATVSAGMVWQQWRAVQVEAAERAQVQSQWILQGALDWARLILREDARSSKEDHLGEPWAVPLAEARLSTFLAADRANNASDQEGLDAFLSGSIQDAQARYNLRNLVAQGKVQALELTTLQRLCETLGLPAQVAQTIADGLRRSTLSASAEVQGDAASAPAVSMNAGNGTGAMPLAPQSVDQLTWLGLDVATIQRLAPHVVLLPQPTPVNLNTAGREVIAAVLTTVDLSAAQRLVQSRQRSPLKKLEDVRAVLGETLPGLDAQRVDIKSNYFEVQGTMRLEQLTVAQRSLLERRNREVRVLRTERVRLSPDATAGATATVNSLSQ